MQEKRNKILSEALKLVPFDGWSNSTLKEATKNSGLPEHYEKIAFKDGVQDAIELFHNQIDNKIAAEVDEAELKEMKIRDRIYYILNIRFKIMEEYKSVIRKSVQFMAIPQNICSGTKILWDLADKSWYMAGDNSTDFNHYTKRATLIAVYSSTLLFWLNDESKKHHETSEFLKRRIKNVMQFEKLKGKIKDKVKGMVA